MNLQTDFWQGAQDTVLIITAEKRWTRGELAACIACYAETLARTDSPEAVIYTRDNLKFIIAFFAALQAGKEVILIQDQPAFRKLEAALKIDDDFIDVARQSGHARLQEVDLSAAQTAFFTSGSSDTPKKIYKTYAALLRELTAVDKYLAPGLKPDTVILTTVSMLHLYGMTFALLYSLAKGLVITGERLDTPEALSAQLAVPGNYWLISSPAFLERLANYRAEYTFASCPYLITSSGGPLSRNGALGLGEIFHTAPVEILGSTETGVVAHRQTALETQWELFPGITAGTDAEG
ncbi:MAG: acyl--CoA ligase, partial [Candidatus Margulisbacteria bacterium]|nr:acyl--CoA ligase [Candidatus Margulisiibacteriota bacterium]